MNVGRVVVAVYRVHKDARRLHFWCLGFSHVDLDCLGVRDVSFTRRSFSCDLWEATHAVSAFLCLTAAIAGYRAAPLGDFRAHRICGRHNCSKRSTNGFSCARVRMQMVRFSSTQVRRSRASCLQCCPRAFVGDAGPVAREKRIGSTNVTRLPAKRRANGRIDPSISMSRKKSHAATNCSGSFRQSGRHSYS